MAELDLLGMTVPPEYGGSGADTVSWCVAQEELARGSAVVADAQLLCKLMCDMLLHNASEEQKRRHLPAMVRGEKICCIAQTEPGTGSDVAGVQTTATPRRRRRLGAERHQALHHGGPPLRPGRRGRHDRPDEGAGRDRAVPGGDGRARLLARRQGASPRDARPRDGRARLRRLPGAGERPPGPAGRRLPARDGLPRRGRIGIGAQALGIAQAAMEAALRYAKERAAFGQPIAGFQAIQFLLADMSAAIEGARLLLRKAAFLKDQGRPIIREAAEAKLVAVRGGPAGRDRRAPDPRRRRLLDGVPARAPLPGRPRVPDLGRARARSSGVVISRQLLK